MSHTDDFDRGLKNRRAVLGDAWVDKSTAGATDFNADFQSLITRFAWNDIWGRPGLDHTTRRLLVLGMTMGLARWEEFELHCGAAIRGGVPIEKIKETLMQGAIYCGVPAANTAFKIAADLLRDERPCATAAAADAGGAGIGASHLQPAAAARRGAGRGRGHAGGAEPCARPRPVDVGRLRRKARHHPSGAALRPPRPRRLGGAGGPVHDGRRWSTTPPA